MWEVILAIKLTDCSALKIIAVICSSKDSFRKTLTWLRGHTWNKTLRNICQCKKLGSKDSFMNTLTWLQGHNCNRSLRNMCHWVDSGYISHWVRNFFFVEKLFPRKLFGCNKILVEKFFCRTFFRLKDFLVEFLFFFFFLLQNHFLWNSLDENNFGRIFVVAKSFPRKQFGWKKIRSKIFLLQNHFLGNSWDEKKN